MHIKCSTCRLVLQLHSGCLSEGWVCAGAQRQVLETRLSIVQRNAHLDHDQASMCQCAVHSGVQRQAAIWVGGETLWMALTTTSVFMGIELLWKPSISAAVCNTTQQQQ